MITIAKQKYTPAKQQANAKYDEKTYKQFGIKLRREDDADLILHFEQAKDEGYSNRQYLRALFFQSKISELNILSAIKNRRSIRKFKPDAVPKEMIEQILDAGMQAPSSKNRQPWKFIVATGASKAEALDVFRKGMEEEKIHPLIPESAPHLSGAKETLKTMEQAPVIIFVANTLGSDVRSPQNPDQRIGEICNAQSIGAAIENMILQATALQLGSLWICDTYFAHDAITKWMGAEGPHFAALAIGFADEEPKARPRKSPDQVIEWRE